VPATKEQIARTFGEMVTRYGYRRTAVEDVARALRISKTTIYEHFSDKEDLYRCAIELWANEQRAHVESQLNAPTALGRIIQVVAIAFADARRGLEAAPHGGVDEPPEIMSEVNARVFGPMVEDLIVAGNDAGEFDVADPHMTAAFAVAIGTEAIRRLAEDPSADTESAALEAIRRIVAGTAK